MNLHDSSSFHLLSAPPYLIQAYPLPTTRIRFTAHPLPFTFTLGNTHVIKHFHITFDTTPAGHRRTWKVERIILLVTVTITTQSHHPRPHFRHRSPVSRPCAFFSKHDA